MKVVVLLTTLVLSLSVQARIIYTYGNGYGSGFCDGNDARWCVDNIIKTARREAVTQAEFDCRLKNGKAYPYYMADCRTDYCNPSYIPIDAPNQFVSCRSECNIQCEVED